MVTHKYKIVMKHLVCLAKGSELSILGDGEPLLAFLMLKIMQFEIDKLHRVWINV